MNILQESQLLEKNQFKKISKLFHFEEALKHITARKSKYRCFKLSYPDTQHVCIEPLLHSFEYDNFHDLKNELHEDLKSMIFRFTQKKLFSLHHINKILSYLHMDLLLIVYQLKHKSSNALIDYLKFETGDSHILDKIYHINGSAKERSNIYTTNKNSVLINVEEKIGVNSKKLKQETLDLIHQQPLISMIEICEGFASDKLNIFLSDVLSYSQKITQLKHIKRDMKFILKIRKIKRTHKKGMYIVNQNTIILDPRHVDSFVHELGHWYHCWFHQDIQLEKEAEKFAESFSEYLENLV